MKNTTHWIDPEFSDMMSDTASDIILDLSPASINASDENEDSSHTDCENRYDDTEIEYDDDTENVDDYTDHEDDDTENNFDSDYGNGSESELESSSDSDNYLDSDYENGFYSDSDYEDSENDLDKSDSSHDVDMDSDYENGFYSDSDYEDSENDLDKSDSSHDVDMDSDISTDDEMVNDYIRRDAIIFDSLLRSQHIFSDTVNDAGARTFLSSWVMDHNVDHTAVNPLLRFLKKIFPKLCIDVRTLMKTPRNREVIDILPGTYVHLGIRKPLDLLLSTVESIPDVVLLTFNIDGVPLSKSSTTGFWLILGRIENILSLRKFIFVVGVYYGKKKPSCFNDFLRPFVSEMNQLIEEYIHHDQHICIKIHAVICDAPAKASIKYIKSHNGFYGCDKCEQKGVKINHRMTFVLNDEWLRNNESFRSRANEGHHKDDDPIIEDIEDLDMVDDFPLDPLHVIYLGVVKRLLRLWLNGDEDVFDSNTINEISDMLNLFGKSQPKEFQRKCRGLSDVGYFKGHEFRTFLLYSGPVALKNKLTPEKYNHFLLLHIAVTILCSTTMCKIFNSLAERLLKEFVNGMAELYGIWNVVYCVHSLIHIPRDVRKYGDLNQYSAFDFESYMYQIKRQIKKHNTHQAELCNRIEEPYSQFKITPKITAFPLFKRPKTVIGTKVFQEVCLPNFTLNRKNGNNWFMTNETEIVRFEHVENIENVWYVYGYERKHKMDFYSIPIQSSKLNIFQSFKREEPGKLYKLNSVAKKLFCMDFETNYDVFVPLNHCE